MKIFFILLVGSQVLGQVFDTTPFPQAITSFTCHGRPPGYYADLETGCRTYHVCDGNSHFTYVCPKRTLFQQRSRICDHSYLVRCEDSPHFYQSENIYSDDEEQTFIHLPVSEESILDREFFDGDFNQTDEFIPTETTPYEYGEISTITTITTNRVPVRVPTVEVTTRKLLSESTTNQQLHRQSIEKFIKFRLKDYRSLFFIPEFENNSILVTPERELLLPVERNDLMKFKKRKKKTHLYSPCPSNCDPKFFLPGFCHPCILIK